MLRYPEVEAGVSCGRQPDLMAGATFQLGEAGWSCGLPCFTVSYLATVRRDGGPRLHPVCPVLADGRLFAAIPRSPKDGTRVGTRAA